MANVSVTPLRIRPRDRDAILQALRAGVVPRRGLQHFQVGRADELRALVSDLATIADGGSAVRFVIGEYGSGKTFFLSLTRAIALEKGLVVASADLGPDRRLHSGQGQARDLYRDLLANLATSTKPEGGAVPSVVERFVTTALQEAQKRAIDVDQVLRERLDALSELPAGYDFAEVVRAYWRAHDTGDSALKSAAVRWLRGEFETRTDARQALGVRSIVEDDSIYDYLKLLARFVRLAGYGGLLVTFDEMVNLYKLAHGRARAQNYEQILRIVNDALQGASVGLGLLFGGTPEFLKDPRRGLYSYEALRTRLEPNTLASNGLRDLSGPVIEVPSLTPEECYVLLGRLRHVHAAGDPASYLVDDEAIASFLTYCHERLGEAAYQTPRSTIRAFLDLLAVLDQNPGTDWRQLLQGVELARDAPPSTEPVGIDNDSSVPVPRALSSSHSPGVGGDDDLSGRLVPPKD